MDSFDADYAALQAAGANALDHAAIIAAIRKNLSYLPDDLSTLTAGNKDLVEEIQTAYAALNSYQKSLLTTNEKATLEELAAIKTEELPAVAVVHLALDADESKFPKITDATMGAAQFGYENLKWKQTPNPDGSLPSMSGNWWKFSGNLPETALAGDYVFIRYYLDTTDELYWPVWSIDGGKTWLRSEPQTLTSVHGVDWSGYYLISYQIPKNAKNDSTVTFSVKMVSKTEYQKMFETLDEATIAKLTNAAIAVVKAAFDACNQSEYDAAGIKALTDARNSGEDNIKAAGTEAEIKAARDKAVAAIKAVPKAKSNIISTDKTHYNSGDTVGSVTVTVENTTWKEKVRHRLPAPSSPANMSLAKTTA